MTKQIELRSHKHASRYVIVDDVDYESLAVHRWNFDGGYATRKINVDGRVVRIRMHRVIANAPADMEVDHINGNALDNRRCNLRVCTHQQNMWNRKKHGNPSGYKGVGLASGRWRAQIRCDGVNRYLGRFDTAEEAARAYDAAARQLHGEFARVNFN